MAKTSVKDQQTAGALLVAVGFIVLLMAYAAWTGSIELTLLPGLTVGWLGIAGMAAIIFGFFIYHEA